MKILVRMTNWVGDCLIATPALRVLRELNPQAHISVMVKSELTCLFEKNTHINEVIPYAVRKGISGISDRLKCAKMLKEKEFDIAIIFPRSWDSAVVPFLARIPHRVGYGNGGRGMLLNKTLKCSKAVRRRHQSEYYVNLIKGNPQLGEDEKKADLVLDSFVEEWAANYFQYHFSQKKVVGIAPGATYGSAKMWEAERFMELAQRLLEQPDVKVVFFGGPAEAKWIEEGLQKVPGVISLAGKISLVEFAALTKRCHVVLTNDSGPMHIAAAVGAPLVVLFGPTNYENTAPMGPHTLIHKRVKCSPCMLRHCPIDHRCMKQISVDEVYKAVLEKIEKGK